MLLLISCQRNLENNAMCHPVLIQYLVLPNGWWSSKSSCSTSWRAFDSTHGPSRTYCGCISDIFQRASATECSMWSFRYLPCSAWADENWAELAVLMGQLIFTNLTIKRLSSARIPGLPTRWWTPPSWSGSPCRCLPPCCPPPTRTRSTTCNEGRHI